MRASDTFTRDANTTAYTAGDVVGDLMEFAGIGAPGQELILTSSLLRYNVAAIPTGMADFRLHLFSAQPTAIADNAAFNVAAADRASYLGYLNLGTILDAGDTLAVDTSNHNKHIRMPQSASKVYGYLQTLAGYTPAANSETGEIALHSMLAS